MAASEFNDRLDYLISYSSQMVFICSDKINKPSEVIEGFISCQSEQTDLALLTANELMPLVSYREKLCKQLLGPNTINDFNRPLNQLLAQLNQHPNPVLISIFQADKLPNKLVKELWELVLQSRFAKNQLQLNILLVGLSDWAEHIKGALATRVKDQPIILDSEQVQSQTMANKPSELEAMLLDNRQQFSQRMQARHQQNNKPSLLKKWWLWALLASLFITVYAGLIYWQYPDKVVALLHYLKPAPIAQQTAQTEPSQAALTTTPLPAKAAALLDAKPIDSSKLSQPKVASKLPPINADKTLEKSATELVTDWSTASAEMAKKVEKIRSALPNKAVVDNTTVTQQPRALQTADVQSKPLADLENVSKALPPATQAQPIVEAVVSNAQDQQADYAVVDEYQPLPRVNPVTVNEPNAALSIRERIQSPDNQALLKLADQDFVLQLAAMSNAFILREFLQQQQISNQVWLYKTQRYGADWYVVLAKPTFSSIEEARAGIQLLPESARKNPPFVKSMQQVKQEIAKTNA